MNPSRRKYPFIVAFIFRYADGSHPSIIASSTLCRTDCSWNQHGSFHIPDHDLLVPGEVAYVLFIPRPQEHQARYLAEHVSMLYPRVYVEPNSGDIYCGLGLDLQERDFQAINSGRVRLHAAWLRLLHIGTRQHHHKTTSSLSSFWTNCELAIRSLRFDCQHADDHM